MEALRSVSLELYRILSQVGSYLAPPLQELSYDTNIPALLALIYGTLGSVAPCQMSANAGAIAYLTNRAGTERRWIWRDTTAYLLGKVVVYTVLGVFAITLGLQLPTGAMVVLRKLFGPLMILLSLQFLGVLRLRLPLGGALSEWLQRHLPGRGDGGAFLLGATYSLAFCPTMALLFFGWLVPLGIRAPGPGGLVLPAIFAVGTAIPLLFFAGFLALGFGLVRQWMTGVRRLDRYVRIATGLIFLVAGLNDTVLYWFL